MALAGFYESPNEKEYGRLQLLPIEDLLAGTERVKHPDYEPDTGYNCPRAGAVPPASSTATENRRSAAFLA